MMASLDENCSLYLTILQSRQKRAPSNATQRDHTTPGLVVQHGISSGTDLVSEKNVQQPLRQKAVWKGLFCYTWEVMLLPPNPVPLSIFCPQFKHGLLTCHQKILHSKVELGLSMP